MPAGWQVSQITHRSCNVLNIVGPMGVTFVRFNTLLIKLSLFQFLCFGACVSVCVLYGELFAAMHFYAAAPPVNARAEIANRHQDPASEGRKAGSRDSFWRSCEPLTFSSCAVSLAPGSPRPPRPPAPAHPEPSPARPLPSAHVPRPLGLRHSSYMEAHMIQLSVKGSSHKSGFGKAVDPSTTPGGSRSSRTSGSREMDFSTL